MGKFEGILLGTDLDGTLLRHDKTVSEENKKAIEYFKSEGGIFTFFTGRIPRGAAPVLSQVLPNGPYGCMNGAGIADVQSGRLIWSMHLAEGVKELLKYADVNFPDVGFEITTEDVYFCKANRVTEKHKTDEEFPELTCDYKSFSEPINKILFGVPAGQMDHFTKAVMAHPVAERFDFIRSDKEYFEVLPKGSRKGNLLVKIAELTGIKMERTIAMGDNDNDVSMLEAAGVGVAVSNASVSAKNAADYFTVSNEEHAVAQIIEDIETGRLVI